MRKIETEFKAICQGGVNKGRAKSIQWILAPSIEMSIYSFIFGLVSDFKQPVWTMSGQSGQSGSGFKGLGPVSSKPVGPTLK